MNVAILTESPDLGVIPLTSGDDGTIVYSGNVMSVTKVLEEDYKTSVPS